MTLAATISAAGMVVPSYDDIRAQLTAAYQSIFGADTVLTPDSQDGQWIAIMSSAINDANQMAVSVYNAYSPSFAQGTGLSRVVKINGIRRLSASESTVNLDIVGVAGTIIENGIAEDVLGQRWLLPETVTIPDDGTITVTATAAVEGAVNAQASTVTGIATPTLGWQTVNNPSEAVPGQPVESDATLRRRQSVSTSLPALSPLASVVAAVANVQGVDRYTAYENDTSITDGDGIPGHSIAVVVEGGDVQDIIDTIGSKKTPGTGTYGTTTGTYTDPAGIPQTINFFVLDEIAITVEVSFTNIGGYTSAIGDLIKEAVAAQISSLDIGMDVFISKIYTAANLTPETGGNTFNITAIEISRDGDPVAPSDVVITFNEAAISLVDNITLIVT